MAFGLGRLRLAPDDFWSMTPREFAAAAEGVFGRPASPMARETFLSLAARFPDHA